jgi:hypothetical protein
VRRPPACGRFDAIAHGNKAPNKEVFSMMLVLDLLAQYGGGGGGGGSSALYWIVIAVVALVVVGGAIWLVSRVRGGKSNTS